MDDTKPPLKYGNQSTDGLLTLRSEYHSMDMVLAFESALGKKQNLAGEGSLTKEERIVLAAAAFQRELNHGGIDASFVNSSCLYIDIVVEAFKAIGEPHIAGVMEKAISCLEIKGRIDYKSVQDAHERIWEDVKMEEEYDERSAGLEEELGDVDIDDQLLCFIDKNRDKIKLNGYLEWKE